MRRRLQSENHPYTRTPSCQPTHSLTTHTRSTPARLTVTALNSWGGKKAKVAPVVVEPEIIAPDYRVAAGFFLAGVGLAVPPLSNPGAGVPLAVIGAFLASRTQKVRFVFDEEAMEVMTVGEDGELSMERENFAVGGRNRWAYNTFTNWEVRHLFVGARMIKPEVLLGYQQKSLSDSLIVPFLLSLPSFTPPRRCLSSFTLRRPRRSPRARSTSSLSLVTQRNCWRTLGSTYRSASNGHVRRERGKET